MNDDNDGELDVPGANDSLDGIEMGTELEPVSGVGREVVGGEESGEDGGEFGAVFEEPIAFEDAERGRG